MLAPGSERAGVELRRRVEGLEDYKGVILRGARVDPVLRHARSRMSVSLA